MISWPRLSGEIALSLRHGCIKAGMIALIAAVLGLVIVAAWSWRPVWQQRQHTLAEIDATRSKLIEAMRLAERARAYAEAQSALDALDARAAAQGRQAGVVGDLSDLARRTGVGVVSQAFRESAAQGEYQPLVQELVLQGRYGAVRQFLHGTHALPTWTVVRKVRLERMRVGSDVKASLTLVTYRRREP